MAELTTSSAAPDQHANVRYFLVLGVLLLLLGLASAGASTLLELTTLVLFGPLLLASSLAQLVTGFIVFRGKERLLHYGAAGLEMVLGFILMANPLLVVGDLVVLVAVFLIASGLLRLARAGITHPSARTWMLTSGGAALVLGICVWLRLPLSGLWVVGLCLALDFACRGVSWIVTALAQGKPFEDTVLPADSSLEVASPQK